MEGFINLGLEKTLFPERGILGGNYTIEVPSLRYPFPSRYIILLYRSPGGGVPEAQDQSLSPEQRGVPGLTGAAVTQEAAAAQVAARGGGRLLRAVRRQPIRRRGVSGEGRREGGWGPPGFLRCPGSAACSFEPERGAPRGSPGAPAGPGFPPLPRPFGPAPSCDQTRLRRRPASSSSGPRLCPQRESPGRSTPGVRGRSGGAAPAGTPDPGRAAVMLLRLPPLRPGGQLAVAGAGVGERSPLAGTPPSPALGSRGRRGAPGPGAA